MARKMSTSGVRKIGAPPKPRPAIQVPPQGSPVMRKGGKTKKR